MKIPRTGLSLIALASCVALTAAACSSSPSGSSSSGKTVLTMWQQWGNSGPNIIALNAMIKEYEHLHPNVVINQTYIANNAKILAAISGGNAPDVLDLGLSGPIGTWGAHGALMSLNSFISSSHLNMNMYVPAAVQAVSVGSTVYGLPFMDFNTALLYNKKLFAEAGLNPNQPPTTVQELYADAVRLTKVGANGRITQLGFLPSWPGAANAQTCTLESLGWAFGGQWVTNNKPTATNADNLVALTWEDSFYKKFGAQQMAAFESSAGAYLTATDPFFTGKLAMTFDGPWNVSFMTKTNPQMVKNIGVASFPAPATDPQLAGTSFIDTNPQVIPRGSGNPQAAFDFIKWETTNAQLATSFANTVYNLPQLKSAATPSYPDAGLFVSEEKSPNAHVWPQTPYSTTYQTDLCAAESNTIAGRVSPASALSTLQQQATAAASSG
jgi:multiple sugar transport system substrate-binding protein